MIETISIKKYKNWPEDTLMYVFTQFSVMHWKQRPNHVFKLNCKYLELARALILMPKSPHENSTFSFFNRHKFEWTREDLSFRGLERFLVAALNPKSEMLGGICLITWLVSWN